MIYRKSYKIDGKIVKKDDIMLLVSNVIEKLKETENVVLKIKSTFCDDLTIESNELSILNDINFERNKLKKISITIYSDSMKNYINLEISNYYFNNEVVIESQDKILFDSLCFTIQERLEKMQNQNKIYKVPQKTLLWTITYCIIFIINMVIIILLEEVFKLNIPVLVLVIIFFIWPFGEFAYIMKYIEKYFPIIQFDFGEKSVNSLQKPNFTIEIIKFVIHDIILPIIISIVSSKLL